MGWVLVSSVRCQVSGVRCRVSRVGFPVWEFDSSLESKPLGLLRDGFRYVSETHNRGLKSARTPLGIHIPNDLSSLKAWTPWIIRFSRQGHGALVDFEQKVLLPSGRGCR